MTWKQTRTVNVNVPCTPGYCLTYVQDIFGIPAKQPSALADWNANTYNHKDSNFPDVVTPIWFSGKSGALKQYGHVAVRMTDGSVWSCSHPTSNKPMHFASIDSLNQYYSGQLIYLGWTEDVEDVIVMKKENKNMPEKVDLYTARRLAYSVLGDKSALTGKRDADLKKNHVGHNLDAAYIAGLFNSTEANINRRNASRPVSSTADSKTLADLRNALKNVLK